MIRGNRRTIPEIHKTIQTSIHNRFDVEVFDANTKKLKNRAVGYNVICDNLWSKLCSGNAYFNYIQYGSGSGTPSASDASLFSRISDASAIYSSYSIDYKTGVFSVRKYIQLSASTAVGKNITEVGIASASGNGNLCTHAMLRDMNGNVISITKSDTDIINIYATVFVHFNPKGHDNGSIKLCCYSYDQSLFGRFAGVGGSYSLPNATFASSSYGLSVGTNGGGLAPTNIADKSGNVGATATWDSSKKTLTFKAGRLEASAFNIGGIRRICFANDYVAYYGSTTPLLFLYPGGSWFPYSSIVSEAVGTGDGSATDFALDFPFAHDLKAYIDGVETTEFTLDYAPTNYGQDSNNYGYAAQMEWLHVDSTPDNHIPYLGITVGNNKNQFKGTRIFYNPAHELGIATIYVGYDVTCYASNDLETWVQIAASGALDYTVPEEYRHYKYWKGVSTSDSGTFAYKMKPPSTYVGKALHFTNPPPEGAVITADYQSDCIAKDANHVFDLTVTIQFNEYNEG